MDAGVLHALLVRFWGKNLSKYNHESTVTTALVKQSKNFSLFFNHSTTLFQVVIHMHANTY